MNTLRDSWTCSQGTLAGQGDRIKLLSEGEAGEKDLLTNPKIELAAARTRKLLAARPELPRKRSEAVRASFRCWSPKAPFLLPIVICVFTVCNAALSRDLSGRNVLANRLIASNAGCPLLARDYAVSTRDTIARIDVVIQFNLLCLRIHHSRETSKASACV